MAKQDFEAVVAFAPQAGEGVGFYDTTLDGITTALETADGLLLGASGEGERDSGLGIQYTRVRIEEGVLAGSFTRPLSTKVKATVGSLSFVTPLVGNRATASGSPVDSEFEPIRGMEALFNALGLVGSSWGSGVGHSLVYGSPNPISGLVYVNGVRLELGDCRASGSFLFTAGGLALLKVEVLVGFIKDKSNAVIPTSLDFNPQDTIKPPVVENVGNDWGQVRGFQTLEVTVGNSIGDVPDSNAPVGSGGTVQEIEGRSTRIAGTLFEDSADPSFPYDQVDADIAGDLSQLSFTVGTPATAATVIEAVRFVAPLPEVETATPTAAGSKAASTYAADLRGAAANAEMELILL